MIRNTLVILMFALSISAIAEPVGTVVVSEVDGHTAGKNQRARFWVSLGKEPTSDVTIGIRSEDIKEGLLEVEELVFTPENWSNRQAVDIVGQNKVKSGYPQNYHIELLPVVSLDASFSGVDADDVLMRGQILSVDC